MKILKKRVLPLLLCLCMILPVASCERNAGGASSQEGPTASGDNSSQTSSADSQIELSDGEQALNENAVAENMKNAIFPMFSNEVSHERGGATATEEAYLDYKVYAAQRHTYTDMAGLDSEVAAVRLAELGVFEKTETFQPNSGMTVAGFLKALMMVCQQEVTGSTPTAELKAFLESTNFLESGVEVEYESVLTNEQLAYFLSRCNQRVDNAEQYKLLLTDYDSIAEKYREGVLQMIAVGITEIRNFAFDPKGAAKRSDIADGLYRLINTGARVIPLYNLGNLYSEGESIYVTKTSYAANEAATRFGFFTNYNKQAEAYVNFGKLSIDRTGFNKWGQIEKSQGVYTWPNFANDSSPHKLGETTIICVDLTANQTVNHYIDYNNIPTFYPQDITNTKTRAAAKRFLYAFVQQMLGVVGGDVILLIDYECDYQQSLYNNAIGWNRAKIFSQWFVEACAVAREAARQSGAADRLKLGVNYNNITDVHKRGVSQNQWMINMAEAADYVTIDTYNFYDDKTDPSYTIQNIRFLMNNYSLGKPVIVVENGLGVYQDDSIVDEVTGLTQTALSTAYYENLFREFRFALERGDFLNSNLFGFLIWCYKDTGGSGERHHGVANDDNTLRENGVAIKNGIDAMVKQNQFNPSYITSVSEASLEPTDITVTSGVEYEKLTYLVTDYQISQNEGKLRIKLSEKGTVFLTVNGKKYLASASMVDSHLFELEGLRNGLNVIDIYFGAASAPSTRTVEKILMY